jgi:subtilisin family serine protease
VKVALFDTGLDPSDAIIRRHLSRITYKSFIPGEEHHTVKNARDENGHGTHCAALLLKVAKNAEIFIGRVTMGKKLESPEYISQVC